MSKAVTSEPVSCWKLAGGRFTRADTRVIIENEFHITLNGRPFITASVTPGLAKEFVVGYLFGQGFIDDLEEIESLQFNDKGAGVILGEREGTAAARTTYRIVSGGGRSAFSEGGRRSRNASTLKVRHTDIFRAMNTLFEKADLYRETEGTHASGLFTPAGEPIIIAEDIGRHNTLDKVIGHALLNKVNCPGTFLASTGRMSSEMVAKVCRAGIPIAASKTAVTDGGLEIGRKCGLTVIGFVRDAGTRLHTDMEVRTIAEPVMKIYTGAARVVCR